MSSNRMKMWLVGAATAVAAFGASTAGAAPTKAPATLEVGAAKIDITPQGALLPAGNSVRDPLYVRVVFLRSQGSCAVIASIDKALVSTGVVDAARARLPQCARDNLVVSATHTHSGGDLPTGWMNPAGSKVLEDAIVNAASAAAAKAKPARMGFTTTELHLNVNRDAFDGQHWYQGVNPAGASDKTLGVLYFVGDDDLPVAAMLNYGMHPIDYYLSGIISADFPGDAAGYVERAFPSAVALFTQGASGDQNPLLSRPLGRLMGPRLHIENDDRLSAPSFWESAARGVREAPGTKPSPAPAKADWDDAQRSRVAEVDAIVRAMGTILGETAIEAMRDRRTNLTQDPRLWSGTAQVTCPGRDRTDAAGREGVSAVYKDGPPVIMNVTLLRLGEVALLGVDSEIYSEIARQVKELSPLRQTAVIGLANGLANSGYVYSDYASEHRTFQVIGSRLKPGCAQSGIVKAALGLIEQSGKPQR